MSNLITDERIAHMHGVAEWMYTHAGAFGIPEKDWGQMYLLGLNHDIGYMLNPRNHAISGAEFFPSGSILHHCIFWHCTSPQLYMEFNHCKKEDIPKPMLLLWYADFMIASSGEDAGKAIGFDKRIEKIKNIYGEDSVPYLESKETVEWLKANINKDIWEVKNG